MPKCRDFEWNDYKVKTRPLGWRSIIRLWPPYLSGSDVSFKIDLRTKSGKKRDFIFTRLIYRSDRQGEHRNICEPYDYRNKPTNVLEHTFKEYLVTTGEYSI
jgi:hypothetical protein